uniref:protein NYNRIN-like n=1 Tax=Myxine glutinosa TaxID=7769 RepID=UPI00358E4792
MGHAVLLQVPHCIHTLLQQRNTQHFTATRLMQYETALIMAPNVTVMRCTVLNPATLLPTKEEGIPHVCTDVVQLISTVRPDLQDTPLQEADHTYYVDGSAKRAWDGSLLSGYAVCSDTETVESGRLPPTWSAQQAELYALTRACEVSEEKAVTIYTDSAYAHGVVHDKGAIWKMRGFLTSAGALIKNGDLVRNLLHSIMLPREIAVVKCRGHQRTDDAVARGNARADEAAAQAANQQIGYNMPVVTRKQGAKATTQTDVPTSAPTEFDVIQLQAAASNVEHQDWIKLGAQRPAEGQMWTINDKPVAPRALLPWLARMAHQNGHVCHRGVMRQVTSTWAAPGLSAAVTMVCRSCAICQRHNRGAPPRRRHNVGHPAPVGPFCHIQFDFFNLPPCMSFKHVLVVVDMFTKWVEAYPCVRADAITVAKCLLRHFICRFGVPQKVSSDQGGHFTGDVIKAVLKALGVIQSFHCVYYPQSAGLVEQTNGTLKGKLAKICDETGLKWPEALPLALMSVRSTPGRTTGLSPHEILMGRPMSLPVSAPVDMAALELPIMDDMLLKFCIGLSHVARSIHERVREALPEPTSKPIHTFEAGDYVLVKHFTRKTALEPRWTGPYQVLLITPTAVFCEGKSSWVHATHYTTQEMRL